MTPFDVAVAIVLLHEGGYSNDPDDPGKETNLGITAATLDLAKRLAIVPSDVAVRGLSVDQAKAIYRMLYWDEIHGDLLPAQLALCLFDAAVNQGVSAAVSLLQDSLHVVVDGVMGHETIQAAQRRADSEMVERFMASRAARYADTAARRPILLKYRAGWLKRCFAVARAAVRLENA